MGAICFYLSFRVHFLVVSVRVVDTQLCGIPEVLVVGDSWSFPKERQFGEFDMLESSSTPIINFSGMNLSWTGWLMRFRGTAKHTKIGRILLLMVQKSGKLTS